MDNSVQTRTRKKDKTRTFVRSALTKYVHVLFPMVRYQTLLVICANVPTCLPGGLGTNDSENRAWNMVMSETQVA